MTPDVEELFVENGDITLRVEVAGDGPLILCIPGWPELAWSWRHQVAHFTASGWRVAALDVRGYGGSSVPEDVEAYTLRELAGDAAAVAAALSDEPVVLLGHDWGAPIAWNTAIRHPDRVRAVAGMSVPHISASGVSMVDLLDGVWTGKMFYFLHFLEPGVIEAEIAPDVRGALKRIYFALSGESPIDAWLPDVPRDAAFLPLLPDPPPGPLSFLDDTTLDHIAAAFERTGMTGALNRYRATPIDTTTDADIIGATVDQPTCFIGGESDAVRSFLPGNDLFADPGAACTDFRGATIVPRAGHWVQQEAPAAVNATIDDFLTSLADRP